MTTRLRIIVRSLFKNRVSTIITVAGFSISISMALVILAFIIGEFSHDQSYPDADRIFRVLANDNRASVREDFREYFLDNYPAIEDACRFNNYGAILTYEDTPFSGQMIVTDSSFFRIFSIGFLSGSINTSLSSSEDIVLTRSFARKVFGDEDPFGKTLIAEYEYPLTVSGIIEDFPANSSIRGDFITNSKKKIKYEGWSDGMGNEVNYFRLFVKTRSSDNISRLEEMLNKEILSIEYSGGYKIEKISLIPFRDSYFTQGIDRSQMLHANLKLIRLLTLVSVIIILLAIFNYINLTTASYSDRFREIGIKKAVGATRMQIFIQFILEAVLLSFVSLMVALLIASFWVPYFERFLGSTVDLDFLYRPLCLLWLIIGVLIISFLSGIYPAISISGLKPSTILMKQRTVQGSTFSLRPLLNILQNIVSITLIMVLIVMLRQIDFIKTKNYGYDTDQLIRVDVHWRLAEKAGIIRDKLLADPAIKNVCFSHGSPGSIFSYSSWDLPGRPDNTMYEITTDTAFFRVFRIPILQGRDMLPTDFNKVCYINETALRESGWETFEGQKYHGLEIIGVVSDFHFDDMYNKIKPLAIKISSEKGVSHLSLRVAHENLTATFNVLSRVWKEVCPGHELTYQFYDEWLDSMYKGEDRLAEAIRLFTVLAVLISCLGIFGLAEFSIRKRTKEIGLRKVNGATVPEVMLLLNKESVKWSAMAFVIAAPLACYIMSSWLKNFAYRTTLSWWIFVLSGLLGLTIALLTVSWQSWRAATRNPVEALRYE